MRKAMQFLIEKIKKELVFANHPWWAIVFIFSFPPLGFWLLWKSEKISHKSKLFLGVLVFFIFFFLGQIFVSSDSYSSALLLKKFEQSRRSFDYKRAWSFLSRATKKDPISNLDLNVVKIDHLLSMGKNEIARSMSIQTQEQFYVFLSQTLGFLFLDLGDYSSFFDSVWSDFQKSGDLRIPSSEILRYKKNLDFKKVQALTDIGNFLCSGIFAAPYLESVFGFEFSKEDIFRLLKIAIFAYYVSDGAVSKSDLLFWMYYASIRFLPFETVDLYHSARGLSGTQKTTPLEGKKPWPRSIRFKESYDFLKLRTEASSYDLLSHQALSELYEKKGLLEKALEVKTHIFKLDTGYFSVKSHLIRLLFRLDKKEEIAIVEMFDQSEKERFSANFIEAIHILEKLLEMNLGFLEPLRDEALYNLGFIYRHNLGDLDKAIPCFEKIRDMNSSFRKEDAQFHLIRANFAKKNFSSVFELSLDFFEHYRNSPRSHEVRKAVLLSLFEQVLEEVFIWRKNE